MSPPRPCVQVRVPSLVGQAGQVSCGVDIVGKFTQVISAVKLLDLFVRHPPTYTATLQTDTETQHGREIGSWYASDQQRTNIRGCNSQD